MNRARTVIFAAMMLAASMVAWAGHGCSPQCCSHCGCACPCEKVCRLVCEMKEISKTTWTCTCEDFCVLGPSHRCACDCACGHCPVCRAHRWKPTAAFVKTRKVPVQHVQKIKVPTYRFVVQYVCPKCSCGCK